MRAASALAALVALCACGAAAGVRPAPVAVRRCCPPGQRLADLAGAELSADEAAAACRPEAEPTPWRPRVYAASLGRFLDPGRLPPHWSERPGEPPACSPLRVLPEHAAAYALRLSNARLLLGGAAASAGGVPPDRYCADARAALVCASDVAWVPSKCCGDALAWDAAAARCVPAPERAAAALVELRALANGSVGAGWPACARGSRYGVAGALRGARLSADGALQLRAADGESASLAAGSWCAEAEAAPAEEAAARVWACETEARADAGAGAAPVRHALYGAGLAVGALFLLLTLLAGLALPAAHRALHWRCQTHYVAALLLGDVLLAATQLAADRVPPGVCRALAVCMHFLFLSAFFWLNTMCFNIWWTFRDFRPTSLERGQEAWRLRVYVAYAVGGPLLLAGAAAALDRLPAGAAGALPRPRFAERRCWFYGDLEVLVYFFGPVGVLLLVNLALFASTTRQLTCGLWRRDEVKSTSERAALGRVCAKLVVVMGVTWGADVVSWAAGGPAYVWYASDLLNALQGVFIFLVAGCQPPARAALRRAARACCRPRTPAGGATSQLPSCGDSLTHTTPAPAPAPAPQAPPAAPRVPMETVC